MALNGTNKSSAANPISESNKVEGPQKPPPPPPFVNFIDQLQTLSTVMQTFHRNWDELHKLTDFIHNAIETKEKQFLNLLPTDQKMISETKSVSVLPCVRNQEPEQTDITSLSTANSVETDLELLCRKMSSRELRRYVVTNLSQVSKLRQEVPSALQLAPNAADLVLKCVGKFYLQSSKGFNRNRDMIPPREAALLVMECFLLMGCNNGVDESVKKEAEKAALAWKKRLIMEGGLSVIYMEDARGLLLLVGCFGIPYAITIEDLMHLFRFSKAREISEAFRKSSFLLAKVPEIIEYMGNRGLRVEALDIIYTMGIEDTFSQRILSPFLKSLKEAFKIARGKADGSPYLLKEANQKQLAALTSLMNCLEAHKIDPAKVMPGWKLKEKITNLEKDIVELEKKIVFKRKAEEESAGVSHLEDFKRPKIVEESLMPIPSPFSSLQEPRASYIEDFKRPKIVEESLMPIPSPFSSLQEPRVTNQLVYQLGSRYPDTVNRHPAASPWPHEYDTTIGISNRSNLYGASFGASISSGSSLPLPSREILAEHNFVGSTELGNLPYMGSSSYTEGYRVTPNFGSASRSSGSDLYQFADVIDRDYVHHSYKPGEMYRSHHS